MSTPAESDSETTVPPEVERAIAENPEAVASLLERSGQLGQLLDALALVEDGLDDEMVERLTGDATTLGMAASELAEPETARLTASVGQHGDELATTVERLAALERTGTLDRLFELADALALVTDAADDEMIETLTETGTALGEVADTAADDEVRTTLTHLLAGIGQADTDAAEPVGAVGLLRALRDPEVKAGMGYLVALARGVGNETIEGSGG
ncbi:helical membrane plugin domain-containing protein [Halobellus marinus]|jgi:uncharacterized protein YjgD (DUF1641 family)|uniref:DUF1641 domain-containing protein n=1 Tax=Halobellus TaxID=1073986 RepID=UPI0028AD50E5|nr:DUF1641 domain-containing protein [Halobellus sp. DFY28]